MNSVFIEPIDVWLFRDGKPFNAGEDHQADSIFPPLPSVIQGALRSHYLVARNVPLHDKAKIEQAVGTSTDYKTLKLRGPFLRRRDELFFPLPADVYASSEKGDEATGLRGFDVLNVNPKSAGESSNPLPTLLWPPENTRPRKFDPSRYWVSQGEMLNYLAGKPFAAMDGKSLFDREPRVGIALNHAEGTTKEGALFAANFIRTKQDVGLHIEMSGLDNWPASGLMRMGGEGHGARFSTSKLYQALPDPAAIVKGKFKVVFITPAYFRQGWKPGDKHDHWQDHFEGKVELKSVALHRYLSAGGYDWSKPAHLAQKPALRYVPAGSVYYFESQSEVRLKRPWLCDAAPNGAQLGQIGFGQVLIGNWQ